MRKKAPKGWIKISDFEELTGISTKTIASAIKRGYIPDNFADRVGSAATSPYYLNPQQSAICWYKSLNAAHPGSRKVRETLAGYIKTFDKSVIEPEKKAPDVPKLTYEDAQLQEKIAKAQMAELDLQVRQGELVERAKVYDQLFAFGQELRNALMAIPDRITDTVIAESDNRHKVHSAIYDAIASELQKLADMQQVVK